MFEPGGAAKPAPTPLRRLLSSALRLRPPLATTATSRDLEGNPVKTLFLSHAAALGGAELYLLDYLKHSLKRTQVHLGRGGDKTLLFAEGAFADALADVGAEVEVVGASRALLGVMREDGGRRSLGAVSGLFGLVRKVARAARDFDVIFANSQKAFVVGALAGRLSQRPVVWCLHDILTAEHFSRANRKLVVALANRLAALVIVNSHATAAAFVGSGGRASLVRVVYNGVDAASYAAPLLKTEQLRAELGIGDAPVVGVFSRLSPWKGQHVLLDALTRLPDVHAVLVGDALFGEETYAQGLYEQTRRLGLASRVHFLGFRRDVPELMGLCDVVAHTSTAPEPFGRVIVEGMFAGKPVVAARGGAVAEIIEPGVSGCVVAPGDAAALAAVLTDLLACPVTARALGAAAKEAADLRFSLPVMAEGIRGCLAELQGVTPPAVYRPQTA